jgi:hypothetical protein
MSSKVKELVDFDWKLLYTLSSDKNEGIKRPSVRLQLSLDSDGTKENLFYEMNDQQLDNLLQKLLVIQQKSAGNRER